MWWLCVWGCACGAVRHMTKQGHQETNPEDRQPPVDKRCPETPGRTSLSARTEDGAPICKATPPQPPTKRKRTRIEIHGQREVEVPGTSVQSRGDLSSPVDIAVGVYLANTPRMPPDIADETTTTARRGRDLDGHRDGECERHQRPGPGASLGSYNMELDFVRGSPLPEPHPAPLPGASQVSRHLDCVFLHAPCR